MERRGKKRFLMRMTALFTIAAAAGASAYFLREHSGSIEPKVTAPKAEENHPKMLLMEANHLSWVLNWSAAGPLYQRAEKLFTIKGDRRNALYAKVGAMRSDAESMSFVDLSEFLGSELSDPIVKEHPRLRL